MSNELIKKIADSDRDYLRDESKYIGFASTISFPTSEEEICLIVKMMSAENKPITIQGAKTGIVGGASPMGGHILNLSKMNKVKDFEISADGSPLLTVEAGITFFELEKEINRLSFGQSLFWPPDPSEKSATVGGAAACGARGSCAYHYGDLADYVDSIRVIDYEGKVNTIRRAERMINFAGEQRDMIDLYLGGEGFYGVISALTLKLIPKPTEIWGIVFFFSNIDDCYHFAEAIRDYPNETDQAVIAAIDFMDYNTIQLIQQNKKDLSTIKELPDVPEDTVGLVYVEIHGYQEEQVETIADDLLTLSMKWHNDPESSWALMGEMDVKKLRNFRHGAPEIVNLILEKVHLKDNRITKLGTDMKCDGVSFRSVITNYERDLLAADLKACIFGHVGGNHLHVNILPEDFDQYTKGKNLLQKWAKNVAIQNGDLITEHGIGKLKKEIFLTNTNQAVIRSLKQIKKDLDPPFMWNRGNILADDK